jgi:hypothetical protein
MLECFHMVDCKTLSVPISMGTKILVEMCPTHPQRMVWLMFLMLVQLVV